MIGRGPFAASPTPWVPVSLTSMVAGDVRSLALRLDLTSSSRSESRAAGRAATSVREGDPLGSRRNYDAVARVLRGDGRPELVEILPLTPEP